MTDDLDFEPPVGRVCDPKRIPKRAIAAEGQRPWWAQLGDWYAQKEPASEEALWRLAPTGALHPDGVTARAREQAEVLGLQRLARLFGGVRSIAVEPDAPMTGGFTITWNPIRALRRLLRR